MKEVRKLIHCNEVHQQGFLGNNIGVAILDTGCSDHIDLQHCIIARKSFTPYELQEKNIISEKNHIRMEGYDSNGHGTHVAGIIAGSGKASKGKYMGIAPMAKLVICQVLNGNGGGSIPNFLKALEWIKSVKEQYNIRIINISVGGQVGSSQMEDALISCIENLWHEGIAVIVAAGNNGPTPGTITMPGSSRKVITVGSYEERLHRIEPYSGRGPTKQCIMKPEILAPGKNIISCNKTRSYKSLSGTSMSAPIVSGALALYLDKYPDATPKQMKYALYKSAKDLGYPKKVQGWGMIDLAKLMETPNYLN